jgi:hypothetical protein
LSGEGKKSLDARAGQAVVNSNLRRNARPGAGNEIRDAIASNIGGSDTHASRKRGIESEEVPKGVAIYAIKHFHLRLPACARTGDNVCGSITIHIASRDIDAAGEARRKSKKTSDEVASHAIKHLHLWRPAGVSTGDNVHDSIAIDVASPDVDATGEARRKSQEISDEVSIDTIVVPVIASSTFTSGGCPVSAPA